MSREDALHWAVCEAVACLNIGEDYQANYILRTALVEYADAPQAPPAAVPVTDAMVERALKVLAFEHDGATFPNAYSFEEVKAERATMRKVLAAALAGKETKP